MRLIPVNPIGKISLREVFVDLFVILASKAHLVLVLIDVDLNAGATAM